MPAEMEVEFFVVVGVGIAREDGGVVVGKSVGTDVEVEVYAFDVI